MESNQSSKVCPCCKQDKPLDQFGRLRDGYQPRCKQCRNDQRKARYNENREKELTWRAQYVTNNPDKCAAYSKEWRAKNPEKARSKSRDYYHRHKEQYRQHALRLSREACRTLADSYVRKVIASLVGYDGHEITQVEIEHARQRIHDKRNGVVTRKGASDQRQTNRAYLATDRAELSDSYVRRLIQASKDYQGGTITVEMIEQARQRILDKRDRRKQRAE
jgi:hypothetical protein